MLETDLAKVEAVRQFFFKASLLACVDGAYEQLDPDIEKYEFSFEEGGFVFYDWYFVDPKIGAIGITTVAQNGVQVLEIAYEGMVPKAAFAFHDNALKAAYIDRIWNGGRGPQYHQEGKWRYTNECKQQGYSFRGLEIMQDDSRPPLVGRYTYSGRFMNLNE